ncbi:MAG: YfhO family protein [Actinomycetota bacterium]|nr:YfhO family protein [Actinomycetota bacterium]
MNEGPTASATRRFHRERLVELARSLGPAAAGPALIVVCILVVMRGFVFGGMMSNQHVDLLPQWLSTFSFLGRSLASGHIPEWDPFSMGGVPFAADPQSGWTYLPAMVLFTVFPSDVAIRLFIVVQPVLAGLGVYWFLRGERVGLAASTVGGLCLGLVMGHSVIALGLPFAGTLAWSALLLASAARVVHARGWPGRFVWVAITAICWGQLANAHLSNGLVMGSAALGLYLAAALVRSVRRHVMPLREGVQLAAVTIVSIPLVNLAVLLPRLLYLPTTSIGAGYDRLDAWGTSLTHVSTRGGAIGFTAWALWPSELARVPGPYLGALAIALSLAWWKSARYRWIGVPMAVYGFVFYLLSLGGVARVLAPLVRGTFLGQFYLHEPYRFVYASIFAVCVLAGLGADALLRSHSVRDGLVLLAPGAGLWLLLFGLAASAQHEAGFLALAIVSGAAAVTFCRRTPSFSWLLPAVIAIELTVSGLIGQGSTYRSDYQALHSPGLDIASYVAPGAIATYLREQMPAGGRYVTTVPRLGQYGFQGLQGTAYWAGLANQRSMIFEVADAGGYNPTQLVRYWTFVRAIDPKPMHYNAAFLSNPPPVMLNLLGVRWLIAAGALPAWATGVAPPAPIRVDGSWKLYPLSGAAPIASVVGRWTSVDSPAAALRTVRDPGFDVASDVVVENGSVPAAAQVPVEGSATFAMVDANAASVRATTSGPAMLLVRIPYERNWHASVDGKPVGILPADYLDMGIPIPAGEHTVQLGYSDPSIGYGLLGTALSLLALLGAALYFRWRIVHR